MESLSLNFPIKHLRLLPFKKYRKFFFSFNLIVSFFFFFFEETPAFQREELVGWNLGLGYQIAQAWAKERAAEASATSTLDKLSLFCLPVGVRPSQELKDRINISSPTQHPTLKTEDVVKAKPGVNLSTPSWNELTDTGLEAVRDFYNTASALLKGNPTDPPKKEGLLSARAASMLVIC